MYIKNYLEKNPENTVRVTRPSRWGNPYPLKYYSLEESLRKYELWLRKEIVKNLDFLKPLYNKNLACTCKPNEKCHVDILLKYIKMRSCKFCVFFSEDTMINCIHHFMHVAPTSHYCYRWELDKSRWELEELKQKKVRK